MYPLWNFHHQYPTRNGHIQPYPTREGHTHLDNQNVLQMITKLESQIGNLVKAIEANNELLRSIEQKQNQVITSGGGSVIVRM